MDSTGLIDKFVTEPSLILFMLITVIALAVVIISMAKFFSTKLLNEMKNSNEAVMQNAVAMNKMSGSIDDMRGAIKDLHSLLTQFLIK